MKMKIKLVVFLLLTLLAAGCIQTQELGRQVGQVKEDLGITEYDMKIGDTVTVDNKLVRLESYDADYNVIFDVDGTKREMRETQDPQIVNGLEITIQKFRYDISDVENNYIHVKIVQYVPKQDEYLFYLQDVKTILGSSVELLNIEKDGTISVRVDKANEDRVMEGKTKLIGNLYITNVKPNYRAIASERYAILKAVERA